MSEEAAQEPVQGPTLQEALKQKSEQLSNVLKFTVDTFNAMNHVILFQDMELTVFRNLEALIVGNKLTDELLAQHINELAELRNKMITQKQVNQNQGVS